MTNLEPKRPSSSLLRIEINATTFLLAIGAMAAVWLFLELWTILLVIVVALMLVGALNPYVAKLEERGMKRGHAVGLVFAGLLVSMGLFVLLTVPRFVSQLSDLLEHLPQSQAALADRIEATKFAAPLAKSVRELKIGDVASGAGRLGLTYSGKVLEVFGLAVSALFLALYFMVDRDRLRGTVFALIPRIYHVRASRILLKLETIVGGYLRGQIITSVMMTIFTFGVLTIARVPNAIALSVFAGVVDVLPYIGAALVCGPAFLASLSQGTTVAVVVFLVLGAYQELESRFIVPRVYGKVLRLPSAMVMIALLVGGKLLGILGALLALPIAAGIREVITALRVELPGDEVDDSEVRALDLVEELNFEQRAAGAPAEEAAAIASEMVKSREENALPNG